MRSVSHMLNYNRKEILANQAKSLQLSTTVQNFSGNPLRVARTDPDKHVIFTKPFWTFIPHTISCVLVCVIKQPGCKSWHKAQSLMSCFRVKDWEGALWDLLGISEADTHEMIYS